jgi:predicted amino acid-binding ACT domain protein
MSLKRKDIAAFLHRIAFIAALFAVMFQTTIHIFNFSLDATQDGIAMELIEDVGEKELEEEKDLEEIEWQSALQDFEQITLTNRFSIINKLQIIGAFSPETHSPPPDQV